jgi:hypothetical protein
VNDQKYPLTVALPEDISKCSGVSSPVPGSPLWSLAAWLSGAYVVQSFSSLARYTFSPAQTLVRDTGASLCQVVWFVPVVGFGGGLGK